MNFKEDATRYPLFLYQVGLEMGRWARGLLKEDVKEAEGWSNRVPALPHRTFL